MNERCDGGRRTVKPVELLSIIGSIFATGVALAGVMIVGNANLHTELRGEMEALPVLAQHRHPLGARASRPQVGRRPTGVPGSAGVPPASGPQAHRCPLRARGVCPPPPDKQTVNRRPVDRPRLGYTPRPLPHLGPIQGISPHGDHPRTPLPRTGGGLRGGRARRAGVERAWRSALVPALRVAFQSCSGCGIGARHPSIEGGMR